MPEECVRAVLGKDRVMSCRGRRHLIDSRPAVTGERKYVRRCVSPAGSAAVPYVDFSSTTIKRNVRDQAESRLVRPFPESAVVDCYDFFIKDGRVGFSSAENRPGYCNRARRRAASGRRSGGAARRRRHRAVRGALPERSHGESGRHASPYRGRAIALSARAGGAACGDPRVHRRAGQAHSGIAGDH